MPQLRQTFRHGNSRSESYRGRCGRLNRNTNKQLAFAAVARTLTNLSAPPTTTTTTSDVAVAEASTSTTATVAPIHDLQFPTYRVQLCKDNFVSKNLLIFPNLQSTVGITSTGAGTVSERETKAKKKITNVAPQFFDSTDTVGGGVGVAGANRSADLSRIGPLCPAEHVAYCLLTLATDNSKDVARVGRSLLRTGSQRRSSFFR
jgi:hypothetical protein